MWLLALNLYFVLRSTRSEAKVLVTAPRGFEKAEHIQAGGPGKDKIEEHFSFCARFAAAFARSLN